MKKLNKQQKVIRWAKEKKTVPMCGMKFELSYDTEDKVMSIINCLKNRGIIQYVINKTNAGMSITFKLTQIAYYNRAIYCNF